MDNLNGFRHVLRDWRYREVPDWARSPVEGDTCHRYCRWLAQYLRSRDFPMNEAQTRYADSWTDKTHENLMHLRENCRTRISASDRSWPWL